ncbi:ABC transporter permease [Rhizobium sp. YIM 134829]|uniref:ABC transporter permease n=1 Tax=Rhizobium sp. YIM 134829 TaxID=3390453 RepID=UPI00397AA6B0
MQTRHAALGLFGVLLLWQGAVAAALLPLYVLPTPAAVLAALWRQRAFLLDQTTVTLGEIVAGLVLGSLFGAAIAFLLAAWPRLGRLAWPMLLVLQAFPVFVLAPILVLWLGFGMASKVAMTVIIIFFPVASAFADGLNRTPQDIVDAAALTPASHWQILTQIRVPLALPQLATGLRVAAPLAPLGAVVGEWVGASGGLGFVMVQANARMQSDMVFAAMVLLAILAVALRLLIDRLTRPFAPWARTRPPVFD